MPSLSAINLFGLIVLGFAILTGVGWVVIGPLVHGSLFRLRSDVSTSQELPLLLLFGIVINYGILLVVQSLSVGLWITAGLGTFGLVCFVISQVNSGQQFISSNRAVEKGVAVIFTSVLFLAPIIGSPLSDWDARSIWFFHAKMIFSVSSIGQIAGWSDPAIAFSHVDYPNLIPALAAQFSHLTGFWNEYLPKLSLFFILVPAVGLIYSFARHAWSFIFILLLALFTLNVYIWNGYMDGYLALYFTLSMLFFGRYLNDLQPIDLLSSWACLFFLLYLKNEGILAVVIAFFVVTLVIAFRNREVRNLTLLNKNIRNGILIGAMILPFVLWTIYKGQWGLANDLEIGSSSSLEMLSMRVRDGNFLTVIASVINRLQTALLLLGSLYFSTILLKKPIHRGVFSIIVISGVYCLGIVPVYLQTPIDLAWHLETSLDRTLLLGNGGLYAAGYFLLNNLESGKIPEN